MASLPGRFYSVVHEKSSVRDCPAASDKNSVSDRREWKPSFFIAGGDYHLQETSPAVDAADTDTAPAIDLDGFPRPMGPAADMGCYEWHRVYRYCLPIVFPGPGPYRR
jgi:hypothetical protein